MVVCRAIGLALRISLCSLVVLLVFDLVLVLGGVGVVSCGVSVGEFFVRFASCACFCVMERMPPTLQACRRVIHEGWLACVDSYAV